ncbi:MAG: hypothetical protein KC621_23955 [Myxococcales bacterium]|nr:hypothetical protein [Myxococcales bacterium]
MVTLWLLACQTDLLGSMGLEPTAAAPADVTPAVVEDAPAEAPEAEAAEGEVPEAEAPSEVAPEEGAEPEGEEAPRPPPADFNPISIPQGRREGGVRWEGVGTKYEHEEKE